MFLRDLRKWRIFNTLEPEFSSSIDMAVVYGDSGDKALVKTDKNEVYVLGYSTDLLNLFKPIKVENLCGKEMRTFVFGDDYILALTEKGVLFECYSRIDYSFVEKCLSNLIAGLIVDIACGGNRCLALTNKGKVCIWEYTTYNEPRTAQECCIDENIIYIACGTKFNMVVTNKGKVYGWGENSVGQIGIGDYSVVKDPSKVVALNDVEIEKVVCGYTHTLALSTAGVLYVWGGNSAGQLGLGTTNHSCPEPMKLEVAEMGRVMDVAALYSSQISVAMGQDNRVFIWGHCLGQCIKVPRCTPLKCLDDAFAYCAWPRVTYRPLIFHKGESSNLINSLKKAFDDQPTSDFIFEVQGRPIYVHKVILKIRCQHFKTMFEGEWRESKESVKKINEFSYEEYRSFLKYLYTDEIDSSTDLVELLEIADMYHVQRLKKRCMEKLIEDIRLENVVSLYSISHRYHAKELERCCFKFAISHMTAVVQIPDFTELNKDYLKQFFIEAAEADIFKT